MTENNKRKKHGTGKKRQFRACLLLAVMLLTVAAAGCFGRRSKPADNPTTAKPEPTEAITPEPTEAATPELTEAATPKPTEAVTPKPTEAVTPEPTEAVTLKPTEAVTPEPTETATPKPTKAATPEPTEEEEAAAKSIEVLVAEAVAGLQLDGWSVPSGGLSFTLDESGLAELKKSQRELYDAILVILKITGDGGTAGWEGIPRTKDGNAFTVTISETYVIIVVIYDGRKEPSPTPTLKPSPSPTPTPSPEPTATPKPTATPTPKPSSGTAFTPSGTGGRVTFSGNTVEVSKAQVGDTVRFGSYEQDNNTGNGAEAIEWLVLDKQDGKLLLLSKDALDAKPYNNEEWVNVTWETCTLRSWLNGTFYNAAFSPAEQGRILTTKVKNEDNPYYGTEGGNDTEDKVFLLSIGEVLRYFDPDPDAYDPARRAKVTAYAEAQGGWVSSSSGYAGNGWWWLRSPGVGSCAASVYSSGDVLRSGVLVTNHDGVVRPAFWLNLES